MSYKTKSVDSGSTAIPKIMVFRPSLEEMKDFSKYLEYMESQGAHEAGLAKIIPPSEWVPRKGGYDDINLMIKSPIQQVVNGSQGIYQQYNIQKRSMSFKEFKKLANSTKHCTPEFFDYDDLERKYWKNITYSPPIYGADVPGSLTDVDCKEFNINNLNSVLDLINESYGVKIMGVNTAYLYFGMWKSTFAWHTEDMDLYSINYLHFGAPKSWYCVPPSYGKKLEKLANRYFSDLYQTCPAFLRHKMTLISPQILKKYSIPYNKITQEYGEFMITFPYAYHAGYNHGLNCAESTNFALPRWVEFGKRATRCNCWSDTVKISMDVFVKRFQPDRYDNWIDGKDVGPDPKDPQVICAAPSPYALEEEVYNKTKPKRQAHKRQLIQSTDGISLECLDDPKCEIEDGPDSIFSSIEIDEPKVVKKIRKRPKYSSSNSVDNEYVWEDTAEFSSRVNFSTNTISSDTNNFDSCQNRELNLNTEPAQTLNADESVEDSNNSLSLNGESKEFKKINTILEELTIRTLQYTENPKAFDDEIKLNLFSSFIEPHCAICTALKPFSSDKEVDSGNLNSWFPPPSSSVLMPKSIFASKISHNTFIGQTGSGAYLLVCSICKICVHSVCYGIADKVNDGNWKCDRCMEKDFNAACCLCPLRGGALKKTACNQWAHLVCALILPNIKIMSDVDMKPIDISEVQSFRRSDRMACIFCNKKSNFSYISNYITGYCVQCNMGNNCSSSFHVTCGYREGVLFEASEQSLTFKIMCKKCKKTKLSKKEQVRNLADIDLEINVIAKCNGFYSYAKVVDKYNELYHHVQFVDNTLVDDIKSCDILNRDCEKDQPQLGDPIEVIWNKQQLHGKYSGSHVCQIYTVLFDNNVQAALKRDEIYLQNEELPKRVQIKLVDSFKNLD